MACFRAVTGNRTRRSQRPNPSSPHPPSLRFAEAALPPANRGGEGGSQKAVNLVRLAPAGPDAVGQGA